MSQRVRAAAGCKEDASIPSRTHRALILVQVEIQRGVRVKIAVLHPPLAAHEVRPVAGELENIRQFTDGTFDGTARWLL